MINPLKFNYYRSTSGNKYITPEKKTAKVLFYILRVEQTYNLSVFCLKRFLIQKLHIKEEASRNEIIRLIRSAIEQMERFKDNDTISRLIIGLRQCIHQPQLSSYLIQLLAVIRQTNHELVQQQQHQMDLQRQEFLHKVTELEQQIMFLQQTHEHQLLQLQQQRKLDDYVNELQKIKQQNKSVGPTKQSTEPKSQLKKMKNDSPQRKQLKTEIRTMQDKIRTLSEKEKKLIQLVKAVRARGIDIDDIYKKIPDQLEDNFKVQEGDIQLPSYDTNVADISNVSQSTKRYKVRREFLID
ncbi:hypothetical protein pb186bvf_005653 [Paramecium bursaria]